MENPAQAAPRCESCGNDGSDGALFLTIDARWRPESGKWELMERDDQGGRAFDCLECDHQTPADGEAAGFPYGLEILASDGAGALKIGAYTIRPGSAADVLVIERAAGGPGCPTIARKALDIDRIETAIAALFDE